jgi:hypothetical protein
MKHRFIARGPTRLLLIIAALALAGASVSLKWAARAGQVAPQGPPPDGSWLADAAIENAEKATDVKLGACQGIAIRAGRIYAYGDVYSAKPRVGVIREYEMDLQPTGREVWLRRAGRPLIIHPTGLTWHDQWGTLLGDTVKKKSVIYRIDWDRAWSDGNLDRAVRDVIDDDAAINGCRPTFVTLRGRTLIATADYGDVHPEIRLYDPDLLLKAHRSSAPGVEVSRVLCGPFNQNLHWDAQTGRLTCVQNVIDGRRLAARHHRPGQGCSRWTG